MHQNLYLREGNDVSSLYYGLFWANQFSTQWDSLLFGNQNHSIPSFIKIFEDFQSNLNCAIDLNNEHDMLNCLEAFVLIPWVQMDSLD
jgi:hypothetical protein